MNPASTVDRATAGSSSRIGVARYAVLRQWWFPFVVASVAFAVDLYTPVATADGLLFLLVMLTCLFAASGRLSIYVATFCTVLIILGHFLSPPMANPQDVAISNRLLALIVVWTSAVFIGRRLRASARDVERVRRRLLALIDASTDFILISDLDGRITYMNAGAREMIGLDTGHEQRTWHLDDFVPRRLDPRHTDGRDYGRAETQLRHLRTGEPIDVLLHTFPIRDPHTGAPESYATVMRDVTELKREQTRARRNEERLQIALETARAGAYDWNLETGQMWWSDGCDELLGLTPGEHMPSYELWRQHVHPDDAERFESTLQAALAHASRYDSIYRLINGRGSEVWVQAHASILRDAGTPKRMIGAVSDITALKTTEVRAWSSERRFRVMADGVPAIIWVTDREGRTEFVNREFYRFFGITPEELQAGDWHLPLHPDDAEGYEQALRSALANRTSLRARTRIRNASGAWRWIESAAEPRVSPSGEFLGLVGMSPDITPMVETQQELKRADRRKDRFLAMLSHELRNPLAPIRNIAGVLALPGLTTEHIHWAQRVIERQTEQMSGLLDDLLDLARIPEGKLQIRVRDTALRPIIDAAIDAARPLIDRKSHHLEVTLPPESVTVKADPMRLSQVISNLLNNAAKYTDPGGRIELTVRLEDDMLCISVKDNGIGIPADALRRVFRMFEQVDDASTRAEGGLGIGLALVNGIVTLHGGTVSAHSEGAGRGTEFVVRLPLPEESRNTAKGNEGGQKQAMQERLRVLVADDNEDAANSLAMLLTLAGHDTRTTFGGESALSTAREFHPQVALLDIGMPDLSGNDVARGIREETWGPEVLLVALSGWGQEEDRRLSNAAGFDAHLTKPVHPEQLTSLLMRRQEFARDAAGEALRSAMPR